MKINRLLITMCTIGILNLSVQPTFAVKSLDNSSNSSEVFKVLNSSLPSREIQQLLQAANDEKTIDTLAQYYLMSIEYNRPFVRNMIIQSLEVLKESLNPSNFQNYKIKLSNILKFTETLFPNANLTEFFINLGGHVSTASLPGMIQEHLRRNPKLISQLYYSVALNPNGLRKLGQIANSYYQTDIRNPRTFTMSSLSLENVLQNVFSMQNRYGENYFLIKASEELGGLHYTILATKWGKNTLKIGILDSLGFDKTHQSPHFANLYANTISQMANIYKTNVVIYTTALKRQHDIVSCPQFILNDFFAFKDNGLFNYVNTIITERPDLITTDRTLGNMYAKVQIIPEHPLMLLPMQSSNVVSILKQTGLVERFFPDPAMFYTDMENRFWKTGADGRLVNIQAQKDMFYLIPLLLSTIL